MQLFGNDNGQNSTMKDDIRSNKSADPNGTFEIFTMTDPKYKKVLSIMNDMNKNLFTEDRRTDSRKISFMLFGNTDNHRNLLAIIRKMLNDMSNLDIDLNKHIELSSYKDAKNEDRVMYLLSEFGYIMLTMYISRNDLILYKEAVIRLFNMYERRLYREFSFIERIEDRIEMVYHIDIEKDFKFTLINNKVLMISSLELAKIFNKEHKDILSKIRIVLDNCSFNFNALNSSPHAYTHEVKTPTGGIDLREEPMYYVTRNMYALLIACYNNTTPELIKLKHKLIVLFDKTIEALDNLKKNNRENLLKYQGFYESKENFDIDFIKGMDLLNSIKRHWKDYERAYPGLNDELNNLYDENLKTKGYVSMSDIMRSCFYLTTDFVNLVPEDFKYGDDIVRFYRPYFHQFLAYLGFYTSIIDEKL